MLSFRDFDWALLGLLLLLCAVSVVEVHSATVHTKFASFGTKQIFWVAAGVAAMFIFSKIDYHRVLDWAPWAYGVGLLALAAVLSPLGHNALGGRRWIKLGPMLVQPSEYVKLVLILMVARYFANLGGRSVTWKEIFKAFALVGIPMLLVMKQPDLGTTLCYTPILVAGLFLGGINLRQGLILLVTAWFWWAASGPAASSSSPIRRLGSPASSTPETTRGAKATRCCSRRSRSVPAASGAKETEKGTQTQGYFLPIPYTDFIFAAFSEEHGFVGAFFVLLLYFLILMRLIQNAQTAADLPGSLIIMGIVAVLTFQIAVNVGMVIGYMPVTGIPLPLMSYGGSSVLFTFLALGVAMNVRMRRFVN